MLKSEIEILTAVALNRCTGKQIATRHIARRSPYIISTIDSLVRRGYITNSKPKGYQLTLKGSQALLEFLPDSSILHNSALFRFLHEHLSKTKEAIKLIDTLGTEYTKKVEELKN